QNYPITKLQNSFLFQIELRQLHIGGGGDFQITRRTHYYYYREAGALDQRSFVGAEEAVGQGVGKGFFQDAVAKTLRGLRHHNAGSRDGGFDERAFRGSFHLLHGVYGGPTGDGGTVLVGGFDYMADDFRGHKGADGIVNEDDVLWIGGRIGG